MPDLMSGIFYEMDKLLSEILYAALKLNEAV
mgnify:CR=1 FL=1